MLQPSITHCAGVLRVEMQRELAAMLPRAELRIIDSMQGHDAFLLEGAAINALVTAALDATAALAGDRRKDVYVGVDCWARGPRLFRQKSCWFARQRPLPITTTALVGCSCARSCVSGELTSSRMPAASVKSRYTCLRLSLIHI